MRTVLTTLLFAFLLVSTTAAQPGPPDHARPIEGVILVKFAPEALETSPQQLRPSELGLQGQQATRLRRLLNARRGPGQKLFRNFTPAVPARPHVEPFRYISFTYSRTMRLALKGAGRPVIASRIMSIQAEGRPSAPRS